MVPRYMGASILLSLKYNRYGIITFIPAVVIYRNYYLQIRTYIRDKVNDQKKKQPCLCLNYRLITSLFNVKTLLFNECS